jgi:hypothetical protein
MRSHNCSLAANDAISLGDAARACMHSQCRGVLRLTTGALTACDCGCHDSDERTLEERIPADGVLQVVEPLTPVKPKTVPEGRKKGRKTRTKGKCVHCGAPTGGQFAPGHDAKLKKELNTAAQGGDGAAYAEILIRNWGHIVTTPKDGVKTAALEILTRINSEARVNEWMSDRNRMRQHRFTPESASSSGGVAL